MSRPPRPPMRRPRRKCLGFLLGITIVLLAGQSAAVSADLFALVNTGEMFVSSDLGTSWSVRSTLPISDAVGLIAGTSSQELYLASERGTVYRSTDAGMNWTATGSVTASDVIDLGGRPDGAIMALTSTGTVWESTDTGTTFSGVGTITASNLTGITVGANANLYALTTTGGVFESTDDGATWIAVGSITTSRAVSLRRFHTDLVVLTTTGTTYRSSDNGVTWTAVGTLSQVGVSGLTQSVNELVAVTKEGLVARSTTGSVWNWVGAVNQLEVRALANDTPQATGVPPSPSPVPSRLVLSPPRPNPTRTDQVITLRVSVSEATVVNVSLFDAQGHQVAVRPPQPIASGEQTLQWNPGIAGSGVYFLRLSDSSGLAVSRRFVVIP